MLLYLRLLPTLFHGRTRTAYLHRLCLEFPAFSWVLSLWPAGWLVVSRVCLLSRVSVSVRAIK